MKRKLIAQLMANNNGVNLRQALLDSAPFRSSLTYTAVPQSAASGTTATFTRATASTWKNNDGYKVTGVAGEIGFVGARRVRNLISTISEGFTSAAWAKSNVTAPSANTIQDTDTAAGSYHYIRQVGIVTVGNTIMQQWWLKAGTKSIAWVLSQNENAFSFFNLATGATGTAASGHTLSISGPDDDGYYLCTVVYVATGTYVGLGMANANGTPNYDGDGTGTILVKKAQVENITGRADQTTPSEYVSVGALDYRSELNQLYLSLPGTAGHYASTPDSVANSITGDIDIRVKCAATDWTPASALMFVNKSVTAGQYAYDFYHSGGSASTLTLRISVDGTALSAAVSSSHGLVDGELAWIRATRVATTGAVAFYKSANGSDWTAIGTGSTTAGNINNGTDTLCFGGQGGAATFNGRIYSAQIYNTIGGTTPVVDFNPHRDATTPTGTITSSTTGEVWTINGASSVVRSDYYHGSFVDGVKCFDTDINGSPIPSSTLLGYLAEGARTNLCLQSQTLTVNGAGVPWAYGVGYNSTVVADQTAAPDGTTTADVLVDDSGTGTGNVIIEQTITVATSSTYTWSIYAKKKQLQWIRLYLLNFTTPANGGCYFDLNTGAVGTATAGITGRIEAAANGFYRCSITFTTDAADTSGAMRVYLADADGDPTVDRDGTSDVYLWGSQFELGSFASSYIPTTTIAVARNADVESVSTSGNIAAAAGSVYLEFTPTHSPSGTIALWGTYVDASNYTAILHDATNLIFRKRIAGVNYDATIANAFVSGTTYKVCATWGAGGTSITLNGTEGTPHADTTAAQIAATMQWGADGNSGSQPFASLRNCRDWLRQLSASERAAVTS